MSTPKSRPDQGLFLREFIDDFFHMGAILPSSSFLAAAAVAHLARKQGPVRVLEAGAGTGSFTRAITPLLEGGDVLDVVEINSKLMGYLQRRFKTEPAFQTRPGVQINFINADIRAIAPTESYDYIVFALPLTNFPPALVEEILNLMAACLKPGGVFSYVKYIFIGRLKYLFGSARVKAEMRRNQAIIQRFTAQYQIERRAVLWNVPPAWVYYWQKLV
jgi:phospholipid N-methyltransferase